MRSRALRQASSSCSARRQVSLRSAPRSTRSRMSRGSSGKLNIRIICGYQAIQSPQDRVDQPGKSPLKRAFQHVVGSVSGEQTVPLQERGQEVVARAVPRVGGGPLGAD